MIRIPNRIELANLPTRIEKLDRLSKAFNGPNLYIKRDDQTGTELGGNKVRKLEFSIKEALDQGCNYLISCGGIQSNHCRATAAAAAKLGLNSYLVLRNNGISEVDGNLFLNKLFGANIRFITPEDYKFNRMEIMKKIKAELEEEGFNPYIIPEGASNGIGTFGYYRAMEEIISQEIELGIDFDAIVLAVGSGGTYGGLFLANKLLKHNSKVIGINVCDDKEYFQNRISDIVMEGLKYLNMNLSFSKDEISIIDGYVGRGYALSKKEELDFIYSVARLEGLVLDPVYTGKAMYGLVKELEKGTFDSYKNILFIHTGGLYGLFPQKDLFCF
jgi:D-cysteine desulfhydrase